MAVRRSGSRRPHPSRLHKAASRCDAEEVKRLLEEGADPNASDSKGRTALDIALERRCLDAVAALIPVTEHIDLVTILATGGDPALVSLLLRHAPQAVKKYAKTAFDIFVNDGAYEAAALLLTHTDINPLYSVAERCAEPLLDLALDLGRPYVNARDGAGDAPLHYAARGGCVKAIEKLAAAGADVNARNKDGRTPLHEAVWWCREGAVAELLRAGADPNIADAEGDTPLHLAYGCDNAASIVRLLLQHGADPNARNKRGRTPLHAAAERCRPDAARLLIEAGAVVNARDEDGRTPLHVAGCYNVVELLLERNADPNARDKDGKTPLHKVYFAADILLKYGANPNVQDEARRTPLHYAAERCDERLVELLLKAGADPNAADINGNTPLHLARCAWTAHLLIEAGARVDLANLEGMTPYHYAIHKNYYMMDVFYASRFGTEVRDLFGRTPLHIAVMSNRSAVETLLRYGADPNARDLDGKTPLDYALEIGDKRTAEALLKAGARSAVA